MVEEHNGHHAFNNLTFHDRGQLQSWTEKEHVCSEAALAERIFDPPDKVAVLLSVSINTNFGGLHTDPTHQTLESALLGPVKALSWEVEHHHDLV